MTLATRVEHPRRRGHTLLQPRYELEAASIRRLREVGVRFVWVHYPSFDFLSKYVDEQITCAQQDVVGRVCDTFESLQSGTVARLPYDSYTRSIGQLVASLVDNPKAAVFLGDILDAEDSDPLAYQA